MPLGPFQVIDPTSSWHKQSVLIEIESGHLRSITRTEEPAEGYLIPGGIEVLCWTGWPADPRAEPLISLATRLYQAGYTEALIASPGGWSSPEMLAQLQLEAQAAPIPVYLLASFWEEGRIAPVESLRAAGAWGWALPSGSSIPWRALPEILIYLRHLGGPVFLLPFWEALAEEVGVPQLPLLALSGWRGTPPFAETLALRLLAEIHRKTGGTLYVGPLTTREGVQIACSENLIPFTALPYLFFSAERLLSYDPFWKLHPPLQEPADREALWQAIAEGQICLIATYHEAIPPEDKDHPWEEAAPGMSALPHGPALFFTMAEQQGLSLEAAVLAWAIRPRQTLGLPLPALKPQAPLQHVLLQPLKEPVFWQELKISYVLSPLPPDAPGPDPISLSP